MKQCRKCNEEKQEFDFSPRTSNPDGLRNECKLCRSAYSKEWYAKPDNKEKAKQAHLKKTGGPKGKRKCWIEDGIGYVPLTKGQIAKVDSEDLNWISLNNWSAWFNEDTDSFYARSQDKMMHREILGLSDSKVWGDHHNHDTLDNRRFNLRSVSPSQNNFNQRIRRDSKSGLKGVTFHKKANKFRASIRINGKSEHLGLFATKEEAYIAYVKAAIDLHGEFICLEARKES